MSYSEIYFAVASISTIAIAGILLLCLLYILSILRDVKKLSKIAKKEAEIISKGFEKGAQIFGNNLSDEASSFVRMVFALLLSYFGGVKRGRVKKV